METDDRLSMNFDIEPEQGVELRPVPQKALDEPVLKAEDEEETTEEVPQDETAESQVEETEDTDDETQEAGEVEIDLSVGQFSNQAGISMKEFFHGIRMPDGRTISQAVDETNEQRAALQQMQTERDQLKEQLKSVQTNYTQAEDPEIVELEVAANLYQKALETADLSQLDQGAAANYRLNQMQAIEQFRRQAQEKRNEAQAKKATAANEALIQANTEILGKVPEWASQEVAARENQAMGAYLRNRGFTDQDLFFLDRQPKYKLLVRDAWKQQTKHEEIKKGATKVRKISKTLKPSAMQGKTKPTLKEIKQTIRNAETRQERQKARLSMEF